MVEERDSREAALAEIERALDALASVPEIEVVIRPRGNSGRQTVFWLDTEYHLRARTREQIRVHLMRQTAWAEVLIAKDGNRQRAAIIPWPDPPGLPFPQRVYDTQLPCRVPREAHDEVEDAPPAFSGYQSPAHSRFDARVALDVLGVFAEVEQRLTGQQIADTLSLASKPCQRTKLNHLLSDMVKTGWLTNARDQRGMGYYPAEEGRRQLEMARQEEEED